MIDESDFLGRLTFFTQQTVYLAPHTFFSQHRFSLHRIHFKFIAAYIFLQHSHIHLFTAYIFIYHSIHLFITAYIFSSQLMFQIYHSIHFIYQSIHFFFTACPTFDFTSHIFISQHMFQIYHSIHFIYHSKAQIHFTQNSHLTKHTHFWGFSCLVHWNPNYYK